MVLNSLININKVNPHQVRSRTKVPYFVSIDGTFYNNTFIIKKSYKIYSVAHRRLLHKLEGYVIQGPLLNCVKAFI